MRWNVRSAKEQAGFSRSEIGLRGMADARNVLGRTGPMFLRENVNGAICENT